MSTSISEETEDRPGTRGERRRARTRASLLDAARTLFARQGIDATRINEITEQADVGFGSFYNHFDSKDAIVAAVLGDAVAAHGRALERLGAELEDPALVVALCHRHIASLARTDPQTAWLLVRLEAPHRVLASALRGYAESDLRSGIDSGRFTVADPDVALNASGGALLGVMRAILEGELGEDAECAHAEGVLRMLGVRAREAARVARAPMPEIG